MFPLANLGEYPCFFALFFEAFKGDLERLVGFHPDAGHSSRLLPLADPPASHFLFQAGSEKTRTFR
jgi:hypothetical protein